MFAARCGPLAPSILLVKTPIHTTPQPALLIPLDDIKCMELARAGGNSATFDVIVHHKDGRLTEFGMLPREELGPLESACVQGACGGSLS